MKIGRLFRKVKTFDTVPSGYSRLPEVTLNATAPTTATVGMLGDIIYDTNNNKWTMIAKVGSNYIWSPEGFPADNTEYASHVEAGVVVWKKKISGTTGSATLTDYNHNITGFSGLKRVYGQINDGIYNINTEYVAAGYFFAISITTSIYRIYLGNAAYYSRPYFVEMLYTKA